MSEIEFRRKALRAKLAAAKHDSLNAPSNLDAIRTTNGTGVVPPLWRVAGSGGVAGSTGANVSPPKMAGKGIVVTDDFPGGPQ